jgi:hypothetical protein
MKDLELLTKMLEVAQKNGCYSLKEAVLIVQAINNLAVLFEKNDA